MQKPGSRVNDLAAGADGAVYVATDDGITVLRDGQVARRLSTFEGYGTTEGIRNIFVDTSHRLWFSTKEEVGYAEAARSIPPDLAVVTMTPAHSPATEPAVNTSVAEPRMSTAVQQEPVTLLDQISVSHYRDLPVSPARTITLWSD